MVLGVSLRFVMEYVSKKKGIEGLNALINEANKKRVIFMHESDIKPYENYPGYYLARILDAAVKVLEDKEQLEEMGRYFGENMNVSFKGLLGRYPPRTSVQIMVVAMRKYLPIFHTGYRTITSNAYWFLVSKLKKEYFPFIEGILKSLFEKHGGIRDIKKVYGKDRIEYTLKF